jgi:YVTN family beta-propeller protein
VRPDGAFAYVANGGNANVSVIDTATNTVTATGPVGEGPVAFGQFIGPLPPAKSVTTLCSTLGDDRSPWLLDQDVFRFTGAKDEKVTLTLTSLPGLRNTGQRATLLLIDNIGKVFFARIDSSTLPNTLTATLPAAGHYLVAVAEHPKFLRGSAFRGDYCVTLESSMQAWRTLAPTRSVEGLLD